FFGFLHEGHFFVSPPYDGMTTMLRRRVLPLGAKERWTSANGRLVLHDKMGHNEPPYDANNPVTRDGQPVVEKDYLTRALTREAVSFIDRHAERPFFLMLAYNAVRPESAPTVANIKPFTRIRRLAPVQTQYW
ncbi:MAG: N-acetylgalactosamine-4-sulfatase, partial [Planctomycetota bacterium]